MQTFTVIAHFTEDLNDPVEFDILSPDGTERVKESQSVDWCDYAERPLDRAVYSLIHRRFTVGCPHGCREIYASNHDAGMNFVVLEVDYDA